MAVRKAKKLKTVRGEKPSVPAKAKKPSRRDVTQTMGANQNTKRLLKRMGFTAD